MELRVKRVGTHDLPVPAYATAGAAAFDIQLNLPISRNRLILIRGQSTGWLSTGFAYEIPPGHALLVFARSGLGGKSLVLRNGTGVIDADYRGELKISLFNASGAAGQELTHGMRVAQALMVPIITPQLREIKDGEELTPTKRGACGLGSTGLM